MFRNLITLCAVAAIALAGTTAATHAQVGNPFGTFEITIKQGGNTIINDTVTIGPGGDLFDLRPSFVDGDPEDFTQIGTVGPGNAPVILKVVSDGAATESFRVTHWYIDVPVSLGDINSPGATSLFDPTGGNIDVTITGLEMDNGAATMPLLLNSPNFYTSFMRDVQGHFYESGDAHAFNAFGNGFIDIQVPGSSYLDGDLSEYTFDMINSGTSASWTWGNIVNPGLATKVNNGLGATINPLDPGYVFELGLAVAFVQVPEPGSLGLLAMAVIPLIRRRRRR